MYCVFTKSLPFRKREKICNIYIERESDTSENVLHDMKYHRNISLCGSLTAVAVCVCVSFHWSAFKSHAFDRVARYKFSTNALGIPDSCNVNEMDPCDGELWPCHSFIKKGVGKWNGTEQNRTVFAILFERNTIHIFCTVSLTHSHTQREAHKSDVWDMKVPTVSLSHKVHTKSSDIINSFLFSHFNFICVSLFSFINVTCANTLKIDEHFSMNFSFSFLLWVTIVRSYAIIHPPYTNLHYVITRLMIHSSCHCVKFHFELKFH